MRKISDTSRLELKPFFFWSTAAVLTPFRNFAHTKHFHQFKKIAGCNGNRTAVE
jgi:hypothetical protein